MRCLAEDSSSGNNDVFVKGRRMKMLHSTPESLSWLTGTNCPKDKSCLSLMDFVITASVTDTLKMFPVIENSDNVLKRTNQKKKLFCVIEPHNFE